MEKILLQIALILIATKLLGALSRKIKMPEVLGALAAGVLIGPTVLHFVIIPITLNCSPNSGS